MINVLLVIHVLIAIALVGVILLQRSEGGALGIGGGGAGAGLMSGRAAGNLLTRATAVLVTVFFITSLALALIANSRSKPSSLMNEAPAGMAAPVKPAEPATPAAPQEPAAPLSK